MSIISKKKLNELLNLSKEPQIDLIEETKKSYKIEITGDKDKVKKSSFEDKVLDFMSNVNGFIKEQKEFNKEQKEFNRKQEEFNKEQKEFNRKVDSRLENIESRLDVVEKDIKEIKNTPTMKKELNNK